MSSKVRSYLCKLLVGLSLLIGFEEAHAQQILLNPDTAYITSGVGTELDFELRVDENTQGIRLFQVIIAFDTTKADTVYTALGTLFSSAGYQDVFNSYIYYDPDYSTTVLRLEGLLFGATAVVDGPGVVADFRIITKTGGTLDMEILEHVMTDINNDPIASTAAGSIVYIDQPPTQFNLISPVQDEQVSILPGDNLTLVWEKSTSVYPGDAVEYTLELSTTSTFDGGTTTTYSGLTDTSHVVAGGSLTLEQTHWYRVTAEGSITGFQTESTPFGRSFYVAAIAPPDPFNLLTPVDGGFVDTYGRTISPFDWEDAASVIPDDTITYILTIADDPGFGSGAILFVDSVDDVSEFDVPIGVLPIPELVYWKVLARNRVDQTRECNSVFEAQVFMRGDMTADWGVVDPVDLSFFVDFMFNGGQSLLFDLQGDLNCDETTDPVDLSWMVDYFFNNGPEPYCP